MNHQCNELVYIIAGWSRIKMDTCGILIVQTFYRNERMKPFVVSSFWQRKSTRKIPLRRWQQGNVYMNLNSCSVWRVYKPDMHLVYLLVCRFQPHSRLFRCPMQRALPPAVPFLPRYCVDKRRTISTLDIWKRWNSTQWLRFKVPFYGSVFNTNSTRIRKKTPTWQMLLIECFRSNIKYAANTKCNYQHFTQTHTRTRFVTRFKCYDWFQCTLTCRILGMYCTLKQNEFLKNLSTRRSPFTLWNLWAYRDTCAHAHTHILAVYVRENFSLLSNI